MKCQSLFSAENVSKPVLGHNVHEMSKPVFWEAYVETCFRRQFVNVRTCFFWEKIRKKIFQNVVCESFTQHFIFLKCEKILNRTLLGIKWYANPLTLLLLNTSCPVLANRVDPDQLASEEAN